MTLPDPTASAALAEDVIRPIWFVFLDFDGQPVRACTAGKNVTPTGTGIPEVDGFEFVGLTAQVASVGSVVADEGGSEAIVCVLSGIPGDAIDDDMLDLIDAGTAWRSRDAMIWQLIRNAQNVSQGGLRYWGAGKMVAVNHGGDRSALKITVQVETYLAAISQASNRTYMDQEQFDPDDLSAAAALSTANGNYSNPVVPQSYDGGFDPLAGVAIPF